MQTTTILSDYKTTIDKALSELLTKLTDARSGFSGRASLRLLDSVRYSVEDAGKRIRPTLALLAAEAVLESGLVTNVIGLDQGSSSLNPAMPAALAIELVHCGSLIHDDLPCMDDDDLRRGKASNHRKFDEATSLLAGDLLLILPIRVLLSEGRDYGIDSWKLSRAALKLSEAISSMICGQALDMDLSTGRLTDGDIDTLTLMQRCKTGALLAASAEIGALLAGADEDCCRLFNSFAHKLGLAFQISDDILDATSSSEVLGKTAGKDAGQNKLTFVKLYGIESAQALASELIIEAKQELRQTGLSTDKLELLADYVISRNH